MKRAFSHDWPPWMSMTRRASSSATGSGGGGGATGVPGGCATVICAAACAAAERGRRRSNEAANERRLVMVATEKQFDATVIPIAVCVHLRHLRIERLSAIFLLPPTLSRANAQSANRHHRRWRSQPERCWTRKLL